MQIRRITLRTADGLNPTPMAMSWVRDGVLMCGMDNEITIYSQWREDSTAAAAACTTSGADGGRSIADHRSLQESDLLSIAQVYPRICYRKLKYSISVTCWPLTSSGEFAYL